MCFEALSAVATEGAYANLALQSALDSAPTTVNAAEATELTYGTCRLQGTHDRIIEAASGRRLSSLQPAVQQVLRLTSHRLLAMNAPDHAVVHDAVDLARAVVGERVTGVVNAISRRIAAHDLDDWLDEITRDLPPARAWAARRHHPAWIARVHRDLLGDQEADLALAANNTPAVPTYAVRPGLAERDQLAPLEQHTRFSPFGFTRRGIPGGLEEVRLGTVGVQDEGSQLVTLALARAATATNAPKGPWLDLCAGPGGKAALMVGLARQQGTFLLANEAQLHRARLVVQGLRAYPDGWQVIVGDGTQPPWRAGTFAAVMADVPCTGLGALRRRPEARWRKSVDDLVGLVPLQRQLLQAALDSAAAPTSSAAGGVVAYVTCSPHPAETVEVVEHVLAGRDDVEVLDAPALLHEVPHCTRPEDPRFVQLWPHRHQTDAMFLALLGRR